MTVFTPKIGLPLLEASQAQKHVTVNESLYRIDAFLQQIVKDFITTPPGSPSEGDSYLIADSATGEWSGQDQKIAIWINDQWEFYQPEVGFSVFNQATGSRFTYEQSGASFRWDDDADDFVRTGDTASFATINHGSEFGSITVIDDWLTWCATDNDVRGWRLKNTLGVDVFEVSDAGVLTVLGSSFWHAGNDGLNSGLDADLFQGLTKENLLIGGTSGFLFPEAGSLMMNVTFDGTNFRAKSTTNGAFVFRNTGATGLELIVEAGPVTAGEILVPDSFFYFHHGNFYSGSNVHLHTGNDGTGSGFDADLFNGYALSAFPRLSATNTFTGSNTFSGTVSFTRDGINSHIGHTDSNNIYMSHGADGFFQTRRKNGGSYDVMIFASNSVFQYKGFNVHHSGADGAGSNVDADLFHGSTYSNFVRKTGEHVFDEDASIRFSHGHESDANDGKIAAGEHGAGLNIIGVQTSAGIGRQIRFWGDLYDAGGGVYKHTSNDGAGSGSDADMIDGYHKTGILATGTDGHEMPEGGSLMMNTEWVNNDYVIKATTNGAFVMRNGGAGGFELRVKSGAVTADTPFVPESYFYFRNGMLFSGGDKHLHTGNDGTGSGFDADLFNGYVLSAFARIGQTVSFGDITHSSDYGRFAVYNNYLTWEMMDPEAEGFKFRNDSGNDVATINGSTGAYTSSSDERLKTNVVDLEDVTIKLSKIKPKRYRRVRSDAEEIGFLAQDVLEEFPELVHEGDDGLLQLNYPQMNAILWRQVQKLTEEVERLKDERFGKD